MPTLVTRFNWGRAIQNDNPILYRQLDEVYTDIAIVVNTKVSKYITDVDPPNNVTASQVNANFDLGDIWINKSTDTAWIMTSRTDTTTVNWQQIT
jgi:hypothetical protein